MPIKQIENAEICSITFLRDYIQIYFEGDSIRAMLAAYNPPVVVTGGKSLLNDEQGYRDALCSFLGLKVKKIDISEEKNIYIVFDYENQLEIPRGSNDVAQESAMLRIENEIVIW